MRSTFRFVPLWLARIAVVWIGLGGFFRGHAAEGLSSENLILITLDGARVEEMFGGLDLVALRSQLNGKPVESSSLHQRYWAPTPEERRMKLMPFFWGELMARHGSIAGNRAKGSPVELTNRHRFSYPGYSELLTGQAHDEVINSNEKKQNPFPTVLDVLQKELKLDGTGIAAFGSWNVIEAIVSNRADSFTANSGFEPYESGDAEMQRLSRLQFLTRTPWDSVRHDVYTFRFALDHLKRHHPRVFYLSLGETDDWAHDKRYDRVLQALEMTDGFLGELWAFLRSDAQYRDRTAILITTDHGRGRTGEDWPHHGAKIDGAEVIWVAFVAPGLSKRGEWTDHETLYMNQFAATATAFLGIDFRVAKPEAGRAIEFSGRQAKSTARTPVVFTTRQDHQNMLDQLGITKLRPGRSADSNSPNAANYDEAKANPYPELPELLKTGNGETVGTPEWWWKTRRPEVVELLESEVYGRIPDNVPALKWEVRQTREVEAGGKAAIQKELVGVVDNSACPEIQVNLSMSLTLPKDAEGPVPVLMSFGWTPFELESSNFGRPRGRVDGPRPPSKRDKLIAAGWGCATLNPSTVQDDAGGWQPRRFGPSADTNAEPTGAGLTRGIIGLTNHGQPRKPDQWGALRAWGWGASRALDYLETVPEADAKRVGIAGVSRYGKAALVAMAFDQRFAMGLIASSGAGGTALYRRNFGESLENLAGSGGYHWMAGNYLKYSAEESSFGRRTAGELPVDSHMMIALCAPRLTFISHGIPEKGDAHWLDHQGSFMAAVAAQPVFRLLGARDLGRSVEYMKEKMPDVNVGLLDGALAWRQHDGGHTDEPNVEPFIRWAQAQWERVADRDLSSLQARPSAHAPVERRDQNSQSAHQQLR